VLASFRCILILNELGNGLPKGAEEFSLGGKAKSSIHNCFNSGEDLDSAISTVFRNLARNSSLQTNASLISGLISESEERSNALVSRN